MVLSKSDYPREINRENIAQTLERAKSVKYKAKVSLFTASLIFAVFASLLPYLALIASSYFIENTPQISVEFAVIIVLSVFLIIIQITVTFLFDLIELAINRLLKLNYREVVFASCILTANYLFEGKRKEAKMEIDGFITSILGLKRSKGRAYSKEINLLSKGRRQMARMFTFSEEKIPELLLAFGTSLYYNDDPLAYLFIGQFIQETQKFGKIEGLPKRIENMVKSYKGIIALVISIITIIATLWSRGII